MKKNNIIAKITLFLVAIIPIIILMVAGLSFSEYQFNNDDSHELQWYYIEETGRHNIDLPESIPSTKNEYSSIYATFPSDCRDIQTIAILTNNQKMKIFIDNEEIYCYDTDEYRPYGKADPTHFHIVQLPKNLENKTIEIRILSPYDKYSGYFSHIKVGMSDDLIRNIYDSYMPQLLVSMLMLFVNVVIMLMLILFFKSKVDIVKLSYLFLSSFFASLLLIGESKMINLSYSNFLTIQLGYASLIVFTIFYALYLYRDCIKEKTRYIFIGFTFISIIHLILATVLQITNVFDLFESSYISSLIVILEIGCYLGVLINRYIKKHKYDHLDKYDYGHMIISGLFFISVITEIILSSIYIEYTRIFSPLCFILYIGYIYSVTILKIIDQADKSNEFESKLRETRNYLAQSQMRPHFIFNTLGAIRTMIMTSPQEAYDMTTNFSKYLRANITSVEPREKILFTQELDHIKVYANIEKQRFKDRLNIVYDIKVNNFFIPPLTVEPLVENAVKHGVCKKVNGGTVKVSTYEDDERIYINVEDNGVGFDKKILDTTSKKGSVGLKYIKLRLEEICQGELIIDSKVGKGTRAMIILHKKEVMKELK